MTVFDIILLFALFAFTWFGLWYGLIYTIGSILGVIMGAWLGGVYYEQLAEKALPFFFGNENLAKVVCFIIIFILVCKAVSFIFYLLDKTFKFVSTVPFLKSINRLFGAILGFLEGMAVLGLAFYFYGKYPFLKSLDNLIAESQIVPYLLELAKIFTPFLPETLKDVDSVLNFKLNFPW